MMASAALKIQVTKEHTQGTSLAVRWLRIRLPVQGTWVQSLVRTLRSHTLQDSWAHASQLLIPLTLEPVLCNKRHCHVPQRRPSAAKIKNNISNLKKSTYFSYWTNSPTNNRFFNHFRWVPLWKAEGILLDSHCWHFSHSSIQQILVGCLIGSTYCARDWRQECWDTQMWYLYQGFLIV